MQYHQAVQKRTKKTVAVIRTFCPALQVSLIPADGLAARAAALDGLAQARDGCEAAMRKATKAEGAARAQWRDFTLWVPKLIEGFFPEAHPLRELLRAVYVIVPETRGKILKRADALLPIWRKADAALAARKPAEGPVRCDGKGAGEAAALRLAMQPLEEATAAALVPLALARTALRTAARAVDKLNKRFSKALRPRAATTRHCAKASNRFPPSARIAVRRRARPPRRKAEGRPPRKAASLPAGSKINPRSGSVLIWRVASGVARGSLFSFRVLRSGIRRASCGSAAATCHATRHSPLVTVLHRGKDLLRACDVLLASAGLRALTSGHHAADGRGPDGRKQILPP